MTAQPVVADPVGTGLLRDPGRFAREVLEPIRKVVGERGLITDRGAMQPHMVAWRDNWAGRVPAVVLPADTAQMAAVMTICAATRTPVVPQGGNTGLTGGGQPHADDSEIVLSTARMNRIRGMDLDNDTITVDAGVVLQVIQEAAAEAGRLFPLSLGAEGSCQIGGNLSTNAGGLQAIRYGTARGLVLGLEVVLPDGRVWDGLRGLRKDNAGYDLKQLFIGAEGTLGIITGATLRLLPRPEATVTAFLATPSPRHAVAWLRRAKAALGETITTMELMERRCLEIAAKHSPRVQDPLAQAYPWYLLAELSGQGTEEDLAARLLRVLEEGLEAAELLDGTVAASAEQAAALWRIREGTPEGQRLEGASFKHDVSVPVSQVDRFIAEADAALTRRFPGIRSFAFGHLGDGNIHYNPVQAEGEPAAEWAARLPEVNRIVHDIVASLGGSITAEHGIGRLRLEEVGRYKAPVEIEMMARLKQCFDPMNLMNPGKMLPPAALHRMP
ncbi:FAD-binding oxidoreductase [Pararoseomonas indoligenes]|uniref:FAD-binding oxidoreductase n=1 Tax=Roseomonas indoligenes TaxID=2820811 RepID=A0A940N2Z9_9PROT|nr:FAD-binding oxidoreductase [Pararoseomonas indoligenes]MBP0496283.1 FAD-binding oxidoreductase [Pararoseomonas indoligenes]